MNPLLVAVAMVTLAATPAARAQSVEEPMQRAAGGAASWTWRAPASREVTVNLARGNVRIVRSNGGETRLDATADDPDGDGSPVTLVVESGPRTVRIFDRYPSSPSGTMRECLPPDGEHGDLWHFQERLTLTLTVPRDARVSATTMTGRVTGR